MTKGADNHFLDFLVEKATPREILAFTIADLEGKRAMALLDKQDAAR
jgi:hypothetical protein